MPTIHRALPRNHLVAPQPPRRPKATRRFERELPNDLWQIDRTQVKLASGEPGWIVDRLDDHARFLLAALACTGPTGEAAWTCFLQASAGYGLPRQLLSDNHASFSGRLHGFEAAFERKLGEVGVELINAAPAHPQTLGKLERFHRTLKEWLEDEGPAADLSTCSSCSTASAPTTTRNGPTKESATPLRSSATHPAAHRPSASAGVRSPRAGAQR